jgi:hypothetical protein
MVILRCAWHPRNYGRPKLLGIKTWRGPGLTVKDALCRKCAARIHPDVRARFGLDVPKPGCGVEVAILVLLAGTMAIGSLARPARDTLPVDLTPRRVAPSVVAPSVAIRSADEAGDRGDATLAEVAVSRARVARPRVGRAVFDPSARAPIATLRHHRPPVIQQAP